jgi:hypothetical protein
MVAIMRVTTRSSAVRFAIAIAILGGKVDAAPSVANVQPYLNVAFENKDKDLELGPELSLPTTPAAEVTHRLKLLARVPFEADSKPSTVQVTKSTGKWRLIGAYDLDLDSTGETGAACFWRFSGRAEWGAERFKYTPLGEAKQDEVDHSFTGELGARWFFGTASKGSSVQLAPQFLARFDRSFKAADKVSLVSLTDGSPATAKEATLNPPTVLPATTLRIAIPIYFGALGYPFAFGPAGSFTFSGADGDSIGAKTDRLRWEAWVYYFPVSKGITNLRMGAAAFGSHRVKGDDKLDRTVIGALLQLRLSTTLLDY